MFVWVCVCVCEYKSLVTLLCTSVGWFVCLCKFMCVCVCERERERECRFPCNITMYVCKLVCVFV